MCIIGQAEVSLSKEGKMPLVWEGIVIYFEDLRLTIYESHLE